MEGKWTYALAGGWTNLLFDSREEAIKEGEKLRIALDKNVLMVGQLQEFCGSYYVENREWIMK